MNVGGLISIIVFYILVLLIAGWAKYKSRKTTSSGTVTETEDVMLASRNIGVIVGFFTLTATWVGGAFINGTVEIMYSLGLVWCQLPFGYALSLIIGGLCFAKKMRSKCYITMLDPFQDKYGKYMGGLLFIPALLGEVFWSAAILSALGATLSVIIEMDNIAAMILSACIVAVYTLFGGLNSVAYTDVVQLLCIFFGLVLPLPFLFTSPYAVGFHGDSSSIWNSTTANTTGNLSDFQPGDWKGTVAPEDTGIWIDTAMLLIFGDIPWQVYFQRILATKTPKRAQVLSCMAGVGCLVMAVPPILMGVIALNTDWTLTEWGRSIGVEDQRFVLPLILMYMCPQWLTYIGLGAVSSAVMSSADSSILSAATLFSRNIYKVIIRPKASEREILWVMRAAILTVSFLATVMGITVKSIYGLFYLCTDLVYVILFPQLVCILYLRGSNTYGSLTGYLVGLFFRLTGGEPLLHLPALIKYPYYNYETDYQGFPFKTMCMIISFIAIIGMSYSVRHLFRSGKLPMQYDVFNCFVDDSKEIIPLKTPVDTKCTCQQMSVEDKLLAKTNGNENITDCPNYCKNCCNGGEEVLK